MREMTGDLFMPAADAIVIPTNLRTKWHRGRECAVMGAGVAKLASNRYRMLQPDLADRMRRDGARHVYVFNVREYADDVDALVVCLPTKDDWREPSDLGLIREMVGELVQLTRAMGWERVLLPRLGCGLGGLDWEFQVRPLLDGLLDDRFTVMTPEVV